MGLKPQKWGTTKDAITTRLSLETQLLLLLLFFFISNKKVIRTLKKSHPSIHDVYNWGSIQ